MRHFVPLFVLALFVYFLWYLMPLEAKTAARAFARQHVWAVTLITVILLAGLVAAFYVPAFKLL